MYYMYVSNLFTIISCYFLLVTKFILYYNFNAISYMGSDASFKLKEVVIMTTYQALSLMMSFGILLIALISYLDRDKKSKK